MSDDELRETLNIVVFLTFTVLLAIAAASVTIRNLVLWVRHIPVPRLLFRDVVLLVGMAWPFLMIFLARAVGMTDRVREHIEWTVITSIPPLIGIAVFVYYELFIIGQPADIRTSIRIIKAHLRTRRKPPTG